MKITVNIKLKGIYELSGAVNEMEKLWKKHPNLLGDIKIEVQEGRRESAVRVLEKDTEKDEFCNDIISEIDEIILKKYKEIKSSGKIVSGIKKFAGEIKWKEPYLGYYIEKRMWKKAEENGDLP